MITNGNDQNWENRKKNGFNNQFYFISFVFLG